MEERLIVAHLRVAKIYSELSYAERLKVGCIVVKEDSVVAIGYNGTPPGWDNKCETSDGSSTLPHVIHAEQNALDKLVRSGISSVDSDVFITHSPCMECAKRLIGAKVRSVYYNQVYRSEEGINLLRQAGIKIMAVQHD